MLFASNCAITNAKYSVVIDFPFSGYSMRTIPQAFQIAVHITFPAD